MFGYVYCFFFRINATECIKWRNFNGKYCYSRYFVEIKCPIGNNDGESNGRSHHHRFSSKLYLLGVLLHITCDTHDVFFGFLSKTKKKRIVCTGCVRTIVPDNFDCNYILRHQFCISMEICFGEWCKCKSMVSNARLVSYLEQKTVGSTSSKFTARFRWRIQFNSNGWNCRKCKSNCIYWIRRTTSWSFYCCGTSRSCSK